MPLRGYWTYYCKETFPIQSNRGIDPMYHEYCHENSLATCHSCRISRCFFAIAGAAFQGLLRNPLADPYTLGVSSGASLEPYCALLPNILTFYRHVHFAII